MASSQSQTAKSAKVFLTVIQQPELSTYLYRDNGPMYTNYNYPDSSVVVVDLKKKIVEKKLENLN